MKRFSTIVITFIFALASWSKEYIPFVEEGKTWEIYELVTWQSYPGYGEIEIHICELNGDTIINGLTYKKFMDNGKYDGGFREEDKKVYFNWPSFGGETLVYDFNLSDNDTYEEHTVKREKDVETSGMKLPVWSLTMGNMVNYWIEGVGSYGHPRWGYYEEMVGGKDFWVVSCSVNGKPIYKNSDFHSGISPICEHQTPVIYDLQGRRLQKKPTKGIFIQNGRKVMGK